MLADGKDGLAVEQVQRIAERAAALRDDHSRWGLRLDLGGDDERLARNLRGLLGRQDVADRQLVESIEIVVGGHFVGRRRLPWQPETNGFGDTRSEEHTSELQSLR